jgi:hypothetical protein
MNRQELIVLLMVAENRTDDLHQIFDRELIRAWLAILRVKGMIADNHRNDPLEGEAKLTDKARAYLAALDTVPLPTQEWRMGQIVGEGA